MSNKFIKNWNEINKCFNKQINVTKLIKRINKANNDNYNNTINSNSKNNKVLLKVITNSKEESIILGNSEIDFMKLHQLNIDSCIYFIYNSFNIIEKLRMVFLLSNFRNNKDNFNGPNKYIDQIDTLLKELLNKSYNLSNDFSEQIEIISKLIENNDKIGKKENKITNFQRILKIFNNNHNSNQELIKIKSILLSYSEYWSNINKEFNSTQNKVDLFKLDIVNLNSIMDIGLDLLTIININYYSTNVLIKEEIIKNNNNNNKDSNKNNNSNNLYCNCSLLSEQKEYGRIIKNSFELIDYLILENKVLLK